MTQNGRKQTSAAFRIRQAVIQGVEVVEADSAISFGRHMHDQFGIGLIERGAQTSFSGRGVVEAGAGDVITVNPGEVHDGTPIGDGGRAWAMLYFAPQTIATMFQDMTEGRKDAFELSHPVVRDAKIAGRFRSLFAAMTGHADGEHKALAEEALFLLLDQLARDDTAVARTRLVPKAMAIARSRIDDDPAEPVSLDDLGRLCGISRFQVLRGFARETGLTPHAYLVQRRLQMARRLIAQGMDLAEAAASSGFADQSHMTRAFVRTYGLSPGRYAAAQA